MKTIVTGIFINIVIVLLLTAGISLAAQQQPILQQTPFGVREIPAPAGTPQPPAAQPQAAPAAPQPAPPSPAAAQPTPAPPQAPAQPAPQQTADEVANIALTMDNADIYGIIKIIADQLKLNY